MVVAESSAASMPPVEVAPTKTSTPLIVVKQQVYDTQTTQPINSDDSNPNDSREGDDEKSVTVAVSTRSASLWKRFRGAFGTGGGDSDANDEQKQEDSPPMETATAMTTPPPPSSRLRRSASFTPQTAAATPSPSPSTSPSPSPSQPRGRSLDPAAMRLRLPRRSVSPRPVAVGDGDEQDNDLEGTATPRKRNMLPKAWPKPANTPPTTNKSWSRRLLPPTPTRSGVSWTPKRTSPAGAAAIGIPKEGNNKKGWMIRDESPVRTLPMMEDDESTSVGGGAPQRPLMTTDVVKSDASHFQPVQRHVIPADYQQQPPPPDSGRDDIPADYQQQPPPPLYSGDGAEAQQTEAAPPVLNLPDSADIDVPLSGELGVAAMPPPAAVMPPSTPVDPPLPPYPLMSSSPGWAPFCSSPNYRRYQWHPSVTSSSHRPPPSVVEWNHATSDMVSSVGGCTMLEEDVTTIGDEEDDRKPRHRVVVEKALVDEELAGVGGGSSGGDRRGETPEEQTDDAGGNLKEMHRKQFFLVLAIVAASLFTTAVAVAVAAVVLKQHQEPRPGESLFASGEDVVDVGDVGEVSLSPSPTTLVEPAEMDKEEAEQELESEPQDDVSQEEDSQTPAPQEDATPSELESPQFEELVEIVSRALPSAYRDSNVFNDETSPQYRAIEWMLDHPFQGFDFDEALMLERFAAVTLYFSTQASQEGETAVSTTESSTWEFGDLNFLSPHSPTCIWNAIGSEMEPMGLFCLDPNRDDHNMNETVTIVDIANNNLVGTLVPELQLFQDLKHLELMNNPLTGPVPQWLFDEGVFERMETVRLGGCDFYGKLPGTLFQSRKKSLPELTPLPLVELYLSRNRLRGAIPDWAPGRLPLLETLYLQNNRLSGTIPTTVENLPHLEHLQLQGNILQGKIPSTLGNLSFLKTLDLRDNLLSGKVPRELANLSNLAELRLNNNPDLEGDIDFLCDLPELKLLTADCAKGKGARVKCTCCQNC